MAHARSLAVAQVVLQADRIAPFGDSRRRKVERAGSQGNHLADKLQDTALHHYRAVGTEILGAVAVEDAGGLYARERFAAHVSAARIEGAILYDMRDLLSFYSFFICFTTIFNFT